MRSRWPLALAVLTAGACARSRTTLPVEPEATFAIHPARDGFVVDRMRDGGTGVLEQPGWLHDPSGPSFILRSGTDVHAALWLIGRSRVLVREDPSTLAPRTGEVLVTWADGAVRLTLWGHDGSTLQTDTFGREDGGSARALLSRDRATSSVAGTYRAVVRDAAGAAVGWMRARIGSDPHEARAYDAVFPARVDDGLAAAASVALDAEIGWLEEHPPARVAQKKRSEATIIPIETLAASTPTATFATCLAPRPMGPMTPGSDTCCGAFESITSTCCSAGSVNGSTRCWVSEGSGVMVCSGTCVAAGTASGS
jgi:hypothetical protein